MRIESVTIQGFRCFDKTGATITLHGLTCFVGPNASGKTAAMMALVRMFGETPGQRQVVPADFHLAAGEELKSKATRSLLIDCRLSFPELDGQDPRESEAVPEMFNQMIIDKPGGTPYCRVHLKATWTNDGTATGEVEQALWWVLTDSDDPAVIEDGKQYRMHPGQRSKIRVMYIPAARDPDHQIRTTAATSFGRLLDALALDEAEETLKESLTALQSELFALSGVQTMNEQTQDAWGEFYDGRVAGQVAFQVIEEDPAGLVGLLVPTFQPGEDGRSMMTSDLGDGLRSLFSLSLSLGLFNVEELIRPDPSRYGFKPEVAEKLPYLNLIVVEEPENHLSPQYLGRVVSKLAQVAEDKRAQVLISSHSPSILSRVRPDDVHYFLGHENTASTSVKSVPLPQDSEDEAYKYVREAVRGFPELYFARLVILGEGPTEEIVLRQLFEASGTPLDTHFISVVPLGGRHVNHFWRLLHGLGISFITLLDLDREKEGAGWGRVQYVRDQLIQLNDVGDENLLVPFRNGKSRSLDDPVWDDLRDRDDSELKKMDAWLSYFAKHHNVFFSSPLDMDLSMLEAFSDVYKSLAPANGGPRMPEPNDPGYHAAVERRMKQVLASDPSAASLSLGSTYSPEQQENFVWYKYLFVDGSKPVTHMRALLQIDDERLVSDAPEVMKQIVERARFLLSRSSEDAV
ncbi:MAG: AAA family ATPase [Caldilineaceae bacterium]|nr:AAA family ATPase [Caldilineaceae bacterium]